MSWMGSSQLNSQCRWKEGVSCWEVNAVSTFMCAQQGLESASVGFCLRFMASHLFADSTSAFFKSVLLSARCLCQLHRCHSPDEEHPGKQTEKALFNLITEPLMSGGDETKRSGQRCL